MANRESLIQVQAHRASMIRHAAPRLLIRDGELCSEDRAFLAELDQLREALADTSARHNLTAYIEKGGDIGKYMNELAYPLGVKIVQLEDHRSAPKVVQFPRNDEMA